MHAGAKPLPAGCPFPPRCVGHRAADRGPVGNPVHHLKPGDPVPGCAITVVGGTCPRWPRRAPWDLLLQVGRSSHGGRAPRGPFDVFEPRTWGPGVVARQLLPSNRRFATHAAGRRRAQRGQGARRRGRSSSCAFICGINHPAARPVNERLRPAPVRSRCAHVFGAARSKRAPRRP